MERIVCCCKNTINSCFAILSSLMNAVNGTHSNFNGRTYEIPIPESETSPSAISDAVSILDGKMTTEYEAINKYTTIIKLARISDGHIVIEFRELSFEDLDRFYKNFKYTKLTVYDDNYVFDENQTVKWNREQIAIHNKRNTDMMKNEKNFYNNSLYLAIKYAMFAAVRSKYVFNIPDDALQIVFDMAYDEHHSDGYNDVLSYLCDAVDMCICFACKMKGLLP